MKKWAVSDNFTIFLLKLVKEDFFVKNWVKMVKKGLLLDNKEE